MFTDLKQREGAELRATDAWLKLKVDRISASSFARVISASNDEVRGRNVADGLHASSSDLALMR